MNFLSPAVDWIRLHFSFVLKITIAIFSLVNSYVLLSFPTQNFYRIWFWN